MTNPSVDIVNLSKTYGSFTAVANLNLKLEGAKCVGFLGPNGAGKTTTLKMLTDLIMPSSGQAFINGENVHTHKKAALESVGTLIETPEIYPSLTPREALLMIAELRGVPKAERQKRIDEAVAQVKMEEWMDKRVGKFSKGMKQRIDIASSLINDPSILLLDEPSTGLDPRGMSEVRDIVKSLKSQNRLIFMSSHILSEVSEVCDEVAMIDHGKLLVYDTLSNVTAKFSGDVNILELGLLKPLDATLTIATISKIPGVVAAEQMDPRNVRIKYGGGLDVQARILSDLVKLNAPVLSYRPATSALEDVYLNLIKETV